MDETDDMDLAYLVGHNKRFMTSSEVTAIMNDQMQSIIPAAGSDGSSVDRSQVVQEEAELMCSQVPVGSSAIAPKGKSREEVKVKRKPAPVEHQDTLTMMAMEAGGSGEEDDVEFSSLVGHNKGYMRRRELMDIMNDPVESVSYRSETSERTESRAQRAVESIHHGKDATVESIPKRQMRKATDAKVEHKRVCSDEHRTRKATDTKVEHKRVHSDEHRTRKATDTKVERKRVCSDEPKTRKATDTKVEHKRVHSDEHRTRKATDTKAERKRVCNDEPKTRSVVESSGKSVTQLQKLFEQPAKFMVPKVSPAYQPSDSDVSVVPSEKKVMFDDQLVTLIQLDEEVNTESDTTENLSPAAGHSYDVPQVIVTSYSEGNSSEDELSAHDVVVDSLYKTPEVEDAESNVLETHVQAESKIKTSQSTSDDAKKSSSSETTDGQMDFDTPKIGVDSKENSRKSCQRDWESARSAGGSLKNHSHTSSADFCARASAHSQIADPINYPSASTAAVRDGETSREDSSHQYEVYRDESTLGEASSDDASSTCERERALAAVDPGGSAIPKDRSPPDVAIDSDHCSEECVDEACDSGSCLRSALVVGSDVVAARSNPLPLTPSPVRSLPTQCAVDSNALGCGGVTVLGGDEPTNPPVVPLSGVSVHSPAHSTPPHTETGKTCHFFLPLTVDLRKHCITVTCMAVL